MAQNTKHISIASENKRYILAKSLSGDNITAHMGAFSFPLPGGGEEIRCTPFVHVPNIIAKIADLVSSYER